MSNEQQEIPEAFTKWLNRHIELKRPDGIQEWNFAEEVGKEVYRHLSGKPSTQGATGIDWIKADDDRPEEYKHLLLWFEGLKTMTAGYMINGSWADENKNHLWCEPDYWAYMPAPPSKQSPPTPTVEPGAHGEAGMPPEKLAEHMQNIKFLMAYYGGKKTYIECMPGDNGAFNIPNTNKWLQEFDVKPGADWQVRRFKFVIQDKLRTIGLSIDTLKSLINWLWAYKSTKDE